jgi:hypothetical protein
MDLLEKRGGKWVSLRSAGGQSEVKELAERDDAFWEAWALRTAKLASAQVRRATAGSSSGVARQMAIKESNPVCT